MTFPIYDISEETWAMYPKGTHEIIFENPESFCTKPWNRQKYLDKMRKFDYVDCEGDIYKVVGFKFCKKKGITKYIPFFATIEFQFEKTGEKYPFEKLKQLIIDRSIETKDDYFEKIARKATTFRELWLGDKKGGKL